jgi:hypothetical protein
MTDASRLSATAVQFTDETPFGSTGVTVGWRFSSLVSVSQGDSVVNIELSVVVDGATGRVVVAYTAARDDWVLPSGRSQDPQGMAEVVWDFESELPEHMESSAVDALASLTCSPTLVQPL